MLCPDPKNHPSKEPTKYGELIALGYKDCLPNGNKEAGKVYWPCF